MISQNKKILSLIHRIRDSFMGSEYIYTNGSCAKFAMILREVFPEGRVLYNADHAVFEYDGVCYDIRGVAYNDRYLPLEDYGYSQIKDVLSQKASIVVKY
jgi:hypothetical protein